MEPMLTLALVTPSLAALVQVIIVLVILGVVLYLLQTYVPMAAPIKTVITVLVVLAVCVWLLRLVGLV